MTRGDAREVDQARAGPSWPMLTDRRHFLAMRARPCSPRPASAVRAGGAAALEPMTGDVVPIGRDEYLARIAKAQRLMAERGIGALLIEPGASMTYFTGVQWWRSERLTAAILPREGEPLHRHPAFRGALGPREPEGPGRRPRSGTSMRSPLATVAGFLRDRRLTGPVGIEETVRFFAVDGLRRAMPGVEIRPGAPVVRGCRMIKSRARAGADAEGRRHHHRRLSPHLRRGSSAA